MCYGEHSPTPHEALVTFKWDNDVNLVFPGTMEAGNILVNVSRFTNESFVLFSSLYCYLNQSLWKGGTAGKEYSKLQNIKRVVVQKKVTFI